MFATQFEYPISNKEYPTDEGKAKYKRQSIYLTRKKAEAIAVFFTLDIGHSVLDIGHSVLDIGYSLVKIKKKSGP